MNDLITTEDRIPISGSLSYGTSSGGNTFIGVDASNPGSKLPNYAEPTAICSMHKNTDKHFVYLISLPGLTKDDILIDTLEEREFFTIIVSLKKETVKKAKMINKPEGKIKIVNTLSNVDIKKDILIEMENGLLEIKLAKKHPIKRKTLTF